MVRSEWTVGIGAFLAPLAVVLATSTGVLEAGEAVGTSSERALARQILDATGVSGGLIVHLGCGDAKLTVALKANDGCLVHALDADPAKVRLAREEIRSRGIYGSVSVDQLRGSRLPYVDNLVNLVVAHDLGSVPMDEVTRVLSPNGKAYVQQDGKWTTTVKPRPAGIDDWTHYLYDATGNPVARDTVVGPPRRLQWVGSPRWARHHDHMASMTALVSSGGRLFYVIDEGPTASIQLPAKWRLVARDAFNGTVLWKREIASWNTHQWPLKSGPAHLTRRLVAVGDRVYTTLSLEAPVTAHDAAGGDTLLSFDGSDHTREILVSDGVLLALAGKEPSKLPDWRRRHTYVWDNTNRANTDWAWAGGTRRILAYDAHSGRALWQHEAPVAPCSLAADRARVIFYDGEKIVCLDRADGEPCWASEPVGASMPVHTSTAPRTLIYEDVVLFAGNDGKMTAFSADDGQTLWQDKQHRSGHQSLRDLLVADGLVWSGFIAGGGDSGVFTGRDPRTGEVRSEFLPDVKIYWFHHRCYPIKATDRYLLASRTGVEFIDPDTEHWETHHWVRGGCIYGILPANGMLYAPMHSCGCYLEAKLNGFNALAPGPVAPSDPAEITAEARLERGPAYDAPLGACPGPTDWPTYRHDPARSGATTCAVAGDLHKLWKTQLGARLTSPVAANGRVFVASVDTHTLSALDAATGQTLWTCTAGGRIDSPPTIYRGLALFGSADGWVYAVRATDGELAWRFRAAAADRRMVAFEQLESAAPVHGSVLVHDGVVYCTAGRSIFLDGGIRLVRLDPVTGRMLSEVVMGERDPESGENMQVHVKTLNMPVALSDVLSCDGDHLYMRSQKMDLEGNRLEIPVQSVNEQPAEGSHLFCQVGFLDDSWFHRSFWTYGRRVDGGYGGWFKAARVVPAGRMLVFDNQRVYGYGRKPTYYVNASVLEYHLFGAEKHTTTEAIDRIGKANGRMNARLDRRNANSSDWKLRRGFPVEDLTAARYQWTMDQPALQVRAMVAAGDSLLVAGHPDFIDERRAYRLPDDPEVSRQLARQAEALEGRHGGRLWAVSKADGRPLARYRLEAPPVFDGMAVADGRLFVSTLDGSVLCLSGDGGTPLRREADTEPISVISDEPEEPDYLKPPPVDKSGDFSKVTGCGVIQSKLGYRIEPRATKQICLVLKRLEKPLSGQATFTAKMNVPGTRGFLTNGFLAFGDGAAAEKLVHCGIRFQPQEARICEGSLTETSKSISRDVVAPIGKVVELSVKVDLDAEKVTLTVGDVTMEANLGRSLKAITHVGFSTDGAVAEFSPLDIASQ